MENFTEILEQAGAVVTGQIFVYKAGYVGDAYINKEALADLGATVVGNCLKAMVDNAIGQELSFDAGIKKVGVLGPAHGAIHYAQPVAEHLENIFPDLVVVTARTQLDSQGNHEIPDKLIEQYAQVDTWLIVEDIVNQGITIKEVAALLVHHFDKLPQAALALVSRGSKTADELGVSDFYPLAEVEMNQYDPSENPSLLFSNLPLNTELGKGKKFVEEFGMPPYKDGTDFSNFSLLLASKKITRK